MKERPVVTVVDLPLPGECTAEVLRSGDDAHDVRLVDYRADPTEQFEETPSAATLVAWHLPNDRTNVWVRALARCDTPVNTIVVGIPDQPAQILACLEAGAKGYVTSDSSIGQMRTCIANVLRGKAVIRPDIVFMLQNRLSTLSRLSCSASASLTVREEEVLELIAEGRSNKEIALQIGRSLHTVKNHVHHILEKLEVCTRREAVQCYRRLAT